MSEFIPTRPSVSEIQQKHISVQRYFEISLLLMLGTAFLTLAATGKLDAVSILLFCAALGIKLWSYARGESGYRLQPGAVSRLSLAYLVFFFFDLLWLGGGLETRLLPATVHLILFITVIKIFSARRYRDYGTMAALSFLMMLVSAVLTVGAGYVVGLALYVIFAISMFISYDIKRGIEKAEQPPRGPHAETARNRVAVENSLLLTTFELAAGIALLGTFLFFVIPRYHAAYLGNLAMQAQNVTGFSETVNLGDSGRIARSNVVVMRIKPLGRPGDFMGVYWRGIGLTHFDGRSWTSENAVAARIAPVWPRHFLVPPAAGAAHRPRRMLHYQVLLAGLPTNVLFAAAQPVEISGRFAWIGLDGTHSLHNLRGDETPLEYTVVSNAGVPAAAELRRASSLDSLTHLAHLAPGFRDRYLNLPDLDPRIAALAKTITQGKSNEYDWALAVQNYLRHHFGYTLDPPSIQPSDPVGSFLFVSRQGYCAYFSSAMALMLRTLGIPARVVNGFQTGEYNRIGGDFIVRARDAHSWVEVYFPSYGWLPFDPTPASAEEQAGWSKLNDVLDAFTLFWNEWIINYDFQHQVLLGQRMDQDTHRTRRWLNGWSTHAAAWGRHAAKGLLARKLWLMVLGVFIALSYWAYDQRAWLEELKLRYGLSLRNRRALGQRDAVLTYRQFQRILRRKGFHRLPSQTPREFALSIAAPSLGPCAAEFTELYNTLRFGRQPVPREMFLDLLQRLSSAERITPK